MMSLAETLSASSELIMGQSSKLDEVFLPVNIAQNTTEKRDMESGLSITTDPDVSASSTNFLDNLMAGASQGTSLGKCYQVSILSTLVMGIIIMAVLFGHEYIKNLLLWLENEEFFVGYAIFLVLFIVVSFPVAWGYILLMVASGYIYSFICGPIVVISGGVLGVTVSHVTMRNCCRSYFYKKFYNEKVEAVIRLVESDHGFKVIALARLTPIPFGLQNGLFALADVPLWKYCGASVMGLLPMAVLNCYLGSTLRSMEDVLGNNSNKTTGYFVFASQLLFTAGLIFYIVRRARVELQRTVINIEKEKQESVGNHIIDC